MNNKFKRITIGFVLPVVVVTIICIGFYFKNAHESFIELTKTEKESDEAAITLTKANWEKYFEYVEEYVPVKNEAGEVERIELDVYYRMKEEYYEKLKSASEQVILMLEVDDTFKEYQITDSKTGAWEFTGNDSKYESTLYKLHVNSYSSNGDMCFWNADTNKCDIDGDTFYQEFEEEMVLQVINETKIMAVEGQITLK